MHRPLPYAFFKSFSDYPLWCPVFVIKLPSSAPWMLRNQIGRQLSISLNVGLNANRSLVAGFRVS